MVPGTSKSIIIHKIKKRKKLLFGIINITKREVVCMKDSLKKGLFLGGIVVFLAAVLIVKGIFQEEDFHAKYEGFDLDADVEL